MCDFFEAGSTSCVGVFMIETELRQLTMWRLCCRQYVFWPVVQQLIHYLKPHRWWPRAMRLLVTVVTHDHPILQRFLTMALIRSYTINMPWFYIAPSLLLAFIKTFRYFQLVCSYGCAFPGLKPNDQKDAGAWGIYPRWILGCWKKSLRSPSSYCFWIWSHVFKIPHKKGGTPTSQFGSIWKHWRCC